MLLLIKIFSIFVSPHSFSEISHRIYFTEINASGVVSLNSYYLVISGCGNLEGATPLFIKNLNFLLNATSSRKFDADEQQYSAANVRSTTRRVSLFFCSKRLHFRRIPTTDAARSTEVFPYFDPQRRDQHYFRDHQKARLFRTCREFFGSISQTSRRYETAGLRPYFTNCLPYSLHCADAVQGFIFKNYGLPAIFSQ